MEWPIRTSPLTRMGDPRRSSDRLGPWAPVPMLEHETLEELQAELVAALGEWDDAPGSH